MLDTLYHRFAAFESLREFFELGGEVLFAIAAVALVMWCLIFERLIYLYVAHGVRARRALADWESRRERNSWHAHRIREALISRVAVELERRLPLLKACIAVCPLLGLLGTVTGMVEVFEVIAISGSGNPRSMAQGVAKATVPTMAGMVAALSGFAVSAYLQQRARRERELLGERMTMDH